MSKTSTPAPATTRFDAFTVREYTQDGKPQNEWLKIGVAFPHKDGKGFNVILQSLPVNGEFQLRLHEPKAD